jgi:hypothetical protein
MWGSEQTITVAQLTPEYVRTTAQLARIHYKRPETWEFLFWVKVLSCNGVPGTWNFQVEFELTVGVGRSVIQLPLPPFLFETSLSGPFPITKFATSMQLPIIHEGSAAPTVPNVVPQIFDHFPAEDIQCSAGASFAGIPTGIVVVANVGAFFAPRSHIRPEWMMNPPQFSGAEIGGA